MSSISIQLKLVCSDAEAAKQLKDALAAFDSAADRKSSALAAVFADAADLEQIRLDGVGSRAEVVSFDYQDSAQQGPLTRGQLQAWLELGVTFLQYEFCDSQTDYRLTEHHHGLMEISAKEFKARAVSTEVPEPKKVATLAKQGADSKVAQAIQRGVDVNAMIAGLPLYVQVISAKYPLPLAMAALAKREIDWRLSVHYAHQYIEGFLEFPALKMGVMLQDIFQAAGPDLSKLLRHEAVWHLLLVEPKAMAWLCQQDSVDLDAPVLHGSLTDEPFGRIQPRSLITREPCNCGSIMYHINTADSGFYDELARSVNKIRGNFQRSDIDASITLLKECGAKAIPPSQPSVTQQLISYLQGSEGAPGLGQLIEMGLPLISKIPGGEHPLTMAAQYPPNWESKISKISELLSAGAKNEHWNSPEGFQETLLKYVFDAEFRLTSQQTDHRKSAGKFPAEKHIDNVLNIFAHPLKHGLNVSHAFKLYLWNGRNHLHYRGGLLGAITLLLCGRHSELRPWCVPLVRLLVAHGAAGNTQAEAVDSSTLMWASYGSLQLTGQWQQVVSAFKKTSKASVLERLEQRQASEGEDAIDAQVIQLLKAPTV